ncbi:hypothetical protein GCM10029992_63630 [Glycomyces albus]
MAELLDALGVQTDEELADHGVEGGDGHLVDTAHQLVALGGELAVALLVRVASTAEEDPRRERGAPNRIVIETSQAQYSAMKPSAKYPMTRAAITAPALAITDMACSTVFGRACWFVMSPVV